MSVSNNFTRNIYSWLLRRWCCWIFSAARFFHTSVGNFYVHDIFVRRLDNIFNGVLFLLVLVVQLLWDTAHSMGLSEMIFRIGVMVWNNSLAAMFLKNLSIPSATAFISAGKVRFIPCECLGLHKNKSKRQWEMSLHYHVKWSAAW